MNPDAIVVFPAGIVPHEGLKNAWRSTTYEDSDAFGTLGGRDRVEATALLAQRYPRAYVVTTSHSRGRTTPSLAKVYAQELCALGVGHERIVEEESPETTQSGLRAALRLAEEKGWAHIIGVSSGFHIPRIRAFLEREHSNVTVECIASETVLTVADPAFAVRFAEVQKTAAYQARLASEARGLAALGAGTYRSATAEDKRER